MTVMIDRFFGLPQQVIRSGLRGETEKTASCGINRLAGNFLIVEELFSCARS